MNNLPPETKALRLEIVAGLIAFVLGFIGALIAAGWLITHFVEPDTPWWQILHTSVSAIIIAVLAGLALAAATVIALSRYHYWRGVHRCRFCGRPLKGAGIRCSCPDAQALGR